MQQFQSNFFLAGFFFDFSMISPRDSFFLCALCGNVTAFFSFALNYTVQRKNESLGEIMEKSKKNKLPARKKIYLELLHQILGHISNRELLAGDTANVWEDVELRIDTDPFCTSCQISSMNKNARAKIPLKPKAPFK